ncbi:FlgO family outer membrane protein [Zoogloea sp.]|jgi:TolB-like protein|uniref:FlgO family outer membrane protein n=1 Tax=Zoogloea sp. TaxID=49181 RepID=UPI0035B1084F
MRTLSLGLISCALLMGCETAPVQAPQQEPTYEQAQNNNFQAANYAAVTELLKRMPAGAVSSSNSSSSNDGSNSPFIVATLVNIDQLEQSSTLGRLISEQVASKMTQLGHNVLELKVRNSVYLKRNEGELLLTREIREVANNHRAQAVIVGTYAESATLVYVNLKVVNPATNVVLAAHDYALPLNKQVRSMLRKTPG